MILPATGDAWAISRSTCSAVGLVVPGGNFRICRLLDCFYGMASIWSHETAHEQKQLRASPDRGVLSRPWCRFSSGRWHSRPTGDLIEVEAARHGAQLAESGAVSRLRTRLQGWQIIASEAFQSFLVGLAGGSSRLSRWCSSRSPATNCGAAAFEVVWPDRLPAPLIPQPVGQFALIYGRQFC